MFQRRKRAAAAARPVAQAAGEADRYRSTFEVEPVGVDEVAGVVSQATWTWSRSGWLRAVWTTQRGQEPP